MGWLPSSAASMLAGCSVANTGQVARRLDQLIRSGGGGGAAVAVGVVLGAVLVLEVVAGRMVVLEVEPEGLEPEGLEPEELEEPDELEVELGVVGTAVASSAGQPKRDASAVARSPPA